MAQIPAGFCQCGCGGVTKPAPCTDKRWGHVIDVPVKFVRGHHMKKGAESPRWKGGRYDNGRSYVSVYAAGHPKANSTNHVHEHVVLAEAALGRSLRRGEHVHHFDENRSNNARGNLVICLAAYHKLMHRRQRARRACGHVDWRCCSFCKTWDDPCNLYVPKKEGGGCYHSACMKRYMKLRRVVRKEVSQ